MTRFQNAQARRRLLNAHGLNTHSRNKLQGSKTFLKKHLPLFLQQRLKLNPQAAQNHARSLHPQINAARSQVALAKVLEANNLLRPIMPQYKSTTGLAWRRIANDVGILSAGRLLASRAKAALASPRTPLGRARLMREFGNLSLRL